MKCYLLSKHEVTQIGSVSDDVTVYTLVEKPFHAKAQ